MSATVTEAILAKWEKEKDSIEQQSAFVSFIKLFKRAEYSLNNKKMVYMQKQTSTETYSFKARKEKGRMVKKGEKAIYIFAYNEKEVEDSKTKEKSIRKYFGIKPVFDVTQTDIITK